jgi:hypothetical protein
MRSHQSSWLRQWLHVGDCPMYRSCRQTRWHLERLITKSTAQGPTTACTIQQLHRAFLYQTVLVLNGSLHGLRMQFSASSTQTLPLYYLAYFVNTPPIACRTVYAGVCRESESAWLSVLDIRIRKLELRFSFRTVQSYQFRNMYLHH